MGIYISGRPKKFIVTGSVDKFLNKPDDYCHNNLTGNIAFSNEIKDSKKHVQGPVRTGKQQ